MSPDPHPSSSNSQNAPSTWTEPPWSGWIETTGDALLILEAARRGLIPRVTRRLVDSERKMITSGSVFVFDEDESGIKRWTDGFFWSPSRILGNFLLYRETEKRGAGHRSARAEREANAVEPEQLQPQYTADGVKIEGGQTLSRPKNESSRLGIDRQRERSLVGSLTNSYKFKPGGMMKKTFSLTIGGVAQHLISYYKVEDVEQGRLRAPSTLPELASLDISPEYLDKTHFRNPPKVEIGVDGVPRYRGEADDVDTSPRLLTTPLTIASPYDEASTSSGKRAKRYEPYGANIAPKRPRKPKNSTNTRGNNADTDTEPTSPTYPSPVQQPTPGYPESLSATTTPYPYYHYQSYPTAPVYSPVPYTGHPVSPIQPPQQTPTPPQQASTSPQQLTYPGYSSEANHSHPQSAYTYYPSGAPGYGAYPSTTWNQYPYAPHHTASTSQQSASGASTSQERSHRDARDEVEDGT